MTLSGPNRGDMRKLALVAWFVLPLTWACATHLPYASADAKKASKQLNTRVRRIPADVMIRAQEDGGLIVLSSTAAPVVYPGPDPVSAIDLSTSAPSLDGLCIYVSRLELGHRVVSVDCNMLVRHVKERQDTRANISLLQARSTDLANTLADHRIQLQALVDADKQLAAADIVLRDIDTTLTSTIHKVIEAGATTAGVATLHSEELQRVRTSLAAVTRTFGQFSEMTKMQALAFEAVVHSVESQMSTLRALLDQLRQKLDSLK